MMNELSCHPEPFACHSERSEESAFVFDRLEGKLREGSALSEKQIHFIELFGNMNPVEFEIGCGKGKFLIGMAERFPDRNFLGVDYAGKWMKVGLKRSEKRQLPNLRFIKAEIREFLKSIPLEGLSVTHIYFPDPWPKRRHRDRRVVDPAFLSFLHSRLLPSGFVELATDDEDYFSQMRDSAQITADLWRQTRESRNERFAGGDLKTNYELKFEAQGKPLYYLELQK